MSNIYKEDSRVASFYSGKTIFLTGGSGFLGKSLIEKLLYSCNNINKIYVLIRDKHGNHAKDRFDKIMYSPVFQRLGAKKVDVLEKITIVNGDITSKNLGLTDDVLKVLEEEVSIVFHLAATVNFNMCLKDSMDINVNGTQEVINLCCRMKNIQSLIHVSTAYSNSDTSRQEIKEIIYPLPMSLGQARNIAELYSDDESLINTFLGKRPNTYTFSKAFAEDLVRRQSNNIPVAIVRPSIVMSSVKEPAPGWIDGWSGSTGLFAGMPSGVLKVAIGRGSNVVDLVPVDIVTNLIVVAATQCYRSEKVKVYNICTSTSNPITCNGASVVARKVTLQYSLNELPWPVLFFTPSLVVYHAISFSLQIIPAYLIDFSSLMTGRKAVQMKVQNALRKVVEAVKYFLLNEWQIHDDNVRSLLASMNSEDKELFNFDVKTIDWDTCLRDYVLGVRKYLLKKEVAL